MEKATLTVLNRYDLKVDPEAFRTAVTVLVARVKAEGHPGVLGYRFWVEPGEGAGRAVIDYTGPEAWFGHHEIAMPWPEMAALQGVAALTEVTFVGM